MSEYRGRFAPSPTGPLHFGSLVAATASYLDARHQQGTWLVRMEDLDKPREQPGAADDILRVLERFGFGWDGPVLYQSARTEAYREALERLKADGRVYPCGCSRKDLIEERYPGTCACGLPPGKSPRAWRVRVEGELVDAVGDFVVRRADGIFAYQLAVVVDDAFQRITDVVRGADLLDSTPRQTFLQRLLGFPTPRYLHVPVALGAGGQKLSKQTGAPPLRAEHAAKELATALAFLGHAPPVELTGAPPEELWRWAIAAWNPARLPTADSLPAPF
jgi:glutamyl-Q tRNA(Asp) synthetase